MSNLFTLRFPFRVSPTHRLNGLESPVQLSLGDMPAQLSERDPYYILMVPGFSTESDARKFADRVWAGLMWAALTLRVPFKADFEFSSIAYTKDPKTAAVNFGFQDSRVDGLISGDLLAVYPSDKNIKTITGGEVSLILGRRADQYAGVVAEGISFPRSDAIRSDTKLQTALDLFVSHFYETSSNARLLTLVMVLECLADSQAKHTTAQQLIDSWHRELLEAQRRVRESNPDSDESESLDALQRELFFRREASLRSRVRSLVVSSVRATDHPDPTGIGRRAVRLYDARSVLVHEGTLPVGELSEALSDADDIVRSVLSARFRMTAAAA